MTQSITSWLTELLPFEPQPGWCARDYTARYFPNAPEVEYHYPVELEEKGEEDPSETLPFYDNDMTTKAQVFAAKY